MATRKHIYAEYPPIKYLCSLLGICFLVTSGIFMAITMGPMVLWYIYVHNAEDKSILFHPESSFSKYCTKYYKHLMRYKQDVFVVNLIIFGAILIPSLLLFIMYIYAKYDGYNNFTFYQHFLIWFAYTLIRIGPAEQHFAYVHTLVHKEGHARNGLFALKSPISFLLNNAFNYWIGLFYGLVPGTYTYGHSVIHHRYNNYEEDAITTGWGQRDSLINYFAYIIQFWMYSYNLTTLKIFWDQGNMRFFKGVTYGNIIYVIFLLMFYILSGYNFYFIFAYLLYPSFEAVVFLSSVNWAWHLFLDPNDIKNEYVSSITIFNGPSNTLNEDYHVVHHQYPSHHWTTHPDLFKKHYDEYIVHNASVFNDTHAIEMWYYAVTGQYDKIAQKYDKRFLNPDSEEAKYDDEQLKTLMMKRVQCTFYNFDKIGY